MLGSPTKPVSGWDLRVVDENGTERERGEIGALVVKLPLPPGSSPTLWNADDRFRDTYLSNFPGYYETADAGYIDEDGYVFVMARTDDIINVAGATDCRLVRSRRSSPRIRMWPSVQWSALPTSSRGRSP